jgi:hypothetical protein
VLVSAANANPFLGWNVGELRMDSRCWRFTVGCVEGWLLGWDVGAVGNAVGGGVG